MEVLLTLAPVRRVEIVQEILSQAGVAKISNLPQAQIDSAYIQICEFKQRL
jgi:hypothetical protein